MIELHITGWQISSNSMITFPDGRAERVSFERVDDSEAYTEEVWVLSEASGIATLEVSSAGARLSPVEIDLTLDSIEVELEEADEEPPSPSGG